MTRAKGQMLENLGKRDAKADGNSSDRGGRLQRPRRGAEHGDFSLGFRPLFGCSEFTDRQLVTGAKAKSGLVHLNLPPGP